MTIRFWGVRGSIAVSGRRYVSGGGNTSCVEIEHEGQRLVLDAGTGLRALAEDLGFAPVELTVLLSHYHWDHIQGIPFFTPAFHPQSRVTFMGAPYERLSVQSILDRQMQAPNFPVPFESFKGVAACVDLDVEQSFNVGPFRVTCAQLVHPNGVVAYRVEADGQSVVYATDVEHGLSERIDERLIRLASGADLLIHDAQYRDEEYRGESGPPRRGWGHSTWNEAVEAAKLSGARRLALYHHDPTRDDAGLDRLGADARAIFPAAFIAREDAVIKL